MTTQRRPFFSLVIPCYNDGRYAPGVYIDRLLTSLLDQGVSKKDVEVIVVDDHSIIPYQGTLDRYRDKMDIKFVETDCHSCNSNAFHHGASIATGQWICFAYHDGVFNTNSLRKIKDKINRSNVPYLLYTDIDEITESDSPATSHLKYADLREHLTGKFYNLDNLWNKFNIEFPQELFSHEAIAITTQVECALHAIGDVKPDYLKTVSYSQFKNDQQINSESDPVYDFEDYVESTIDTCIDICSKGTINKDQCITLCISQLCSLWFKSINLGHNHENECTAICSRVWNRLKQEFQLLPANVKVMVCKIFPQLKSSIDAMSAKHNSPNLNSWIDILDKFDYVPIIDKMKSDRIRNSTISFVPIKPVRPFFSLVIACYNDGRYAEGNYLDRLLGSICKQGLEREDIEVILSDDCSPVPFDSIVAKYESKLNIKRTKTDYNCCPGNTRAKGVEIASGEWLCFADHDDIYYDGALKKVKDGIVQKNEKYFAFGDFYGVDPDGKVVRKFEQTLNWCHAKFYNIDNFWNPQNIHFIKDLKSHEDIAICTQAQCAIEALGLPNYTYFHFPVYAWTDNPQSVSHSKYTIDTESGPREFLEVFFDDYVHATGYIYIEKFKKHIIKMESAIKGSIEIMLYCYFYTQGFQFRRPNDFYKGNLKSAGNFIRKCMNTFNINLETIYKVITANDAYMYARVKALADPGSGRYVPVQTVKEWLHIVDLMSDDLTHN